MSASDENPYDDFKLWKAWRRGWEAYQDHRSGPPEELAIGDEEAKAWVEGYQSARIADSEEQGRET